MRRTKTHLFSRRSNASPPSTHPPLDENGAKSPVTSNNQSSKSVKRDREERNPFDGSRSRIGLSMGFKSFLSGTVTRRSAANGASPTDPHFQQQQNSNYQHHQNSSNPSPEDMFKWGKKRREVFGARAAQFQDTALSSSLMTTDAPPLRYSNSNLRIAGWLSKRGKRLGSRIDRFFQLNGSILSNSRSETSRPTWSINVRGSKVLPGHGREIIFKIHKTFTTFSAPSDELHKKWIKALQAVSGNVTDFYDFGKLIGRGAYSEVFIARDKQLNELCAVKVLERSNAEHAKLIDRELAVLRILNHQNIVQIYDIFDSARETYVVMEYLAGGELLDLITESDHLSEKNSKQVIREVLQAVQYLHARGIVHRDVKPENILCVNRAWPLRVKLTDFGLSKMVGNGEDGSERVMRSQCGTAYYLAPEIANNFSYSKPVDLWACGVVLYVMLAGKFPFYGDTDDKFMRRLRGGVKFPEKEWNGISADAKALVRGLLDAKAETRLSASEALQHRWLMDDMDVTTTSNPAQTVKGTNNRLKAHYNAMTEPLSLQLGEFASRVGGKQQRNDEFGESENDLLRTDNYSDGGGGGSAADFPTAMSSAREVGSSEYSSMYVPGGSDVRLSLAEKDGRVVAEV